ncbi:MAG: hypothetical protein HYS87_01055 [Candidatus Colwellbacteria bacterium]|nr:hypothetical protein [Candidatus Colwellbacteria bacterium]
MIIGTDELLRLVKEKGLVKNLSERELTNPEGAGFDLRLKEIYSIEGEAFLGIDYRETPKTKLVASYKKGVREKFTINPGDFYLITTIEEVNLPKDITVNLEPRSTTYRSGLYIRMGNAAPGYKGNFTFALKNEGPVPVTLELGARIVHAQFYRVDGGGSKYRGQWQGGRVTTDKKEKQI